MALLGSDFDPNVPQNSDPVSEGAAQIRDIKQRLKDFMGVLFDLETGLFKDPQSVINVGTEFPDDPNVGDTVYNTTNNTAYVYLDSGWTPLIAPSLPVGTIVMFSGTIAQISSSFANLGGDAEWVLANGDAISRTTYEEYFNLIGTTEGVGDGSTTFNIPDLRDKFVVGASADDSGSAKSTVSDGSTLLRDRAYTAHGHTLPGQIDTPQDGTNTTVTHYPGGTTTGETSRAIPPFFAQAFVIRIK